MHLVMFCLGKLWCFVFMCYWKSVLFCYSILCVFNLLGFKLSLLKMKSWTLCLTNSPSFWWPWIHVLSFGGCQSSCNILQFLPHCAYMYLRSGLRCRGPSVLHTWVPTWDVLCMMTWYNLHWETTLADIWNPFPSLLKRGGKRFGTCSPSQQVITWT